MDGLGTQAAAAGNSNPDVVNWPRRQSSGSRRTRNRVGDRLVLRGSDWRACRDSSASDRWLPARQPSPSSPLRAPSAAATDSAAASAGPPPLVQRLPPSSASVLPVWDRHSPTVREDALPLRGGQGEPLRATAPAPLIVVTLVFLSALVVRGASTFPCRSAATPRSPQDAGPRRPCCHCPPGPPGTW